MSLDTLFETVAKRLFRLEVSSLGMGEGDGNFCNHALVFSVWLDGVCGGVEEASIADRLERGNTDRWVIGQQVAARSEEGDDARAGKIGRGSAAAIGQEALRKKDCRAHLGVDGDSKELARWQGAKQGDTIIESLREKMQEAS